MQELKPLTINRSMLNEPSVLLTSDYRKFLLYAPLNQEMIIGNHLYTFITKHFKLNKFETAYFNLKGKRFLCVEQIHGVTPFDTFYDFLWESKRKFNSFLRPRSLFELFLFDLFFPLWSRPIPKLIVADKKNRFAVDAVVANDFQEIYFSPLSINQLGMDHPSIRLFFSYFKEDLLTILDDFLALFHEKFQVEVKYQLSYYPEHRNAYWNEVKQCFEPAYINYVKAAVHNYIIRLS
jgi:hypothetical protein